MTLTDAEKIVQQYGAVLATESANNGPAYCVTSLKHSPQKIVQAMKLWLAHEVQNRSLTEEFRNEIGTAAGRLTDFVDNEEARRLNAISSNFSKAKREGLSARDFVERTKAIGEVHKWSIAARTAGLSLRCELTDFITAVEQFDPNDSLYWQRVYTLLGIEYSAAKKRSFWSWFS